MKLLHSLVYFEYVIIVKKMFFSNFQVGADGINSLVRKRMNIEPFTINYNQMGLVATVELSDVSLMSRE